MAHKPRKTKSEHPSGRPEHEQAKRPSYKVQQGSKGAARLPGHGMRTR